MTERAKIRRKARERTPAAKEPRREPRGKPKVEAQVNATNVANGATMQRTAFAQTTGGTGHHSNTEEPMQSKTTDSVMEPRMNWRKAC